MHDRHNNTADVSGVQRVAIVGTGSVARLHVEALRALPDVAIVAAVDSVPGRAAEFASIYGIARSFSSVEELLDAEQLDIVHLCTPPSGHAAQAIAVLARGAHVVVEKPPALSLAELERMLAAAAANGRQLAVVFQQRTGSAAAAVKRMLDSGTLGRPLVATCHTLWYREQEYFDVPWRGTWQGEGGGTTFSHGIHQIDLLAYLLGDWAGASGTLWRQDREVETEDVSIGTVRFTSGAVASVVTSAVSPRQTSSIRIDTDKATIELDHLYGHARANWKLTPAPHVSEADVAGWTLPIEDQPSSHEALIRALYAGFRTGAALPDVVSAPTRAFEIVSALYASARLGSEVTPQLLRTDRVFSEGNRSTVTDTRRSRHG